MERSNAAHRSSTNLPPAARPSPALPEAKWTVTAPAGFRRMAPAPREGQQRLPSLPSRQSVGGEGSMGGWRAARSKGSRCVSSHVAGTQRPQRVRQSGSSQWGKGGSRGIWGNRAGGEQSKCGRAVRWCATANGGGGSSRGARGGWAGGGVGPGCQLQARQAIALGGAGRGCCKALSFFLLTPPPARP